MKKHSAALTKQLLEKGLISETQFTAFSSYRSLNIFSIHTELRFLLYLSILLFSGGIGILIYKNIDTIGHSAIIAVLFILIVVCFYYCFKNAKPFSKSLNKFENPVFDYLVLLATLLTCTLIGYIQFEYKIFGNSFGIATLLSSITAFGYAYYFDNRSALSIAITALAAYVGISITPQTVFENEIYDDASLSYSGIGLGVLLILWSINALKINLKTHFNIVYLTFALHVISICCIAGLIDEKWYFFIVVLAASAYCFNRSSYSMSSISLYVFNLIYGYIGLNIIIYRTFDVMNISDFWETLVFLLPVYFIISIVVFIKLIKRFNKHN